MDPRTNVSGLTGLVAEGPVDIRHDPFIYYQQLVLSADSIA
jgi:hypothetical protein